MDSDENNNVSELKSKVCFVALSAYNIISKNEDIKHMGGAEIQQLIVAGWLRDHGYDVRFITHDHGQNDKSISSGFTIFKSYNKYAGLPLLRFFYPRWFKLNRALKNADAEIYYQRGAGIETGQVAIWCKLNGKKFIFSAASEADCNEELPFLKVWREKFLYKIGLRLADVVLAQTERQQSLLKQIYGIDSTIVPNVGEVPAVKHSSDNKNGDKLKILWVGRISQEKRFEWLIDIAEKCPDYEFDVVGDSNSGASYADRLLTKASSLKNVNVHGCVPHHRMEDFYLESDVLCLTSPLEGFPNTFLEAWKVGVPVVTSYDPDGMVGENKLGWVVNSVEGFVNVLHNIKTDNTECRKLSITARDFYVKNHSVDVLMPKLEKFLKN